MSKNAEPRAEQQARLIAMPRRESFSASAKERRAEKAFQRQQKSAVFSRLRCKVMKNNTGRQFSGHRVDTSKQKVDSQTPKVDSKIQKVDSKTPKVESNHPQKSTNKKRHTPHSRSTPLYIYNLKNPLMSTC